LSEIGADRAVMINLSHSLSEAAVPECGCAAGPDVDDLSMVRAVAAEGGTPAVAVTFVRHSATCDGAGVGVFMARWTNGAGVALFGLTASELLDQTFEVGSKSARVIGDAGTPLLLAAPTGLEPWQDVVYALIRRSGDAAADQWHTAALDRAD